MSWLLLFAAILFELMGTTSMKLSQGLTRPVPSILLFVFYGVSFGLMPFVLKHIDVSVAYAIWSGIGTAAISVVGLVWFREPMTALKLIFTVLIVIGAVGLNLVSRTH
jgi:small multidrug resistance pump